MPNAKFTLGGKGHTLLRLSEAVKVKNVEILFVGSSQVYRGYDPRIFKLHGLNTFNLGSSAQTPFASYYLLKEHIPKMKLKFVVLDLFWVILYISRVEAGIDLISNSEINNEILDMVWDSDELILYNTLLISGANQLLFSMDTSFQREYNDEIYISGGYTQSRLDSNSLSLESLQVLQDYRFNPAPLQIEYLKKIVALCKEEGTMLVLTVSPVTNELKYSVVNYDKYSSLIEVIAKENHLSQSGDQKFNNLFIEDFMRMKNL